VLKLIAAYKYMVIQNELNTLKNLLLGNQVPNEQQVCTKLPFFFLADFGA
jgi:hypothetical protein